MWTFIMYMPMLLLWLVRRDRDWNHNAQTRSKSMATDYFFNKTKKKPSFILAFNNRWMDGRIEERFGWGNVCACA
jgi:hypothetical protein